MILDKLLILASPSLDMPVGGCFCVMVAPSVIIAIAFYVEFEDPLPLWAFALVLAFTSLCAYFLVTARFPVPTPQMYLADLRVLLAWVVVVNGPVILICEGLKRGWGDRGWEGLKRIWPRRQPKRKKRRGGKAKRPEDPGHGHS